MNEEQQSNEMNDGKIQEWIQDNLRIIISIIVVLVIAGGIYSYSKRSENLLNNDIQQATEESSEQGIISSEEEIGNTATTGVIQTQPVAVSQETEKSFVESAMKGEGTTHLARRALANYLEKNPDSTLTPEHKIYIEDYLRKNVSKSGVKIGTSVEFSKDLIQNAITKSKTLNDKQLQNLHKYAVRVPSLT